MSTSDRIRNFFFRPAPPRHLNIFARVRHALLKPAHFWVIVGAEKSSMRTLYLQYIMLLAAIPAGCAFIGMLTVGVGTPSAPTKVPFMFATLLMALTYLLSLAMVYVLSLAINALAPSFDALPDPLRALKLAAYASTAGMLGGIFGLFPPLGFLSLFGAAYSVYLIYLGLPVLMRCPKEKAFTYALILLPVTMATGAILYASLFTAHSLFGVKSFRLSQESEAYIVLNAPSDPLKSAPALRPEETQKQLDIIHSNASADRWPIAPDALKDYLSLQIGPFTRTTIEVSTVTRQIPVSVARADYEAGHQKMMVTILDAGGLSHETLPRSRETETTVERTWQEHGRILYHKYEKNGSHAELKIILRNGVTLVLNGTRISADLLKTMSLKMNLTGLENHPRQKKG